MQIILRIQDFIQLDCPSRYEGSSTSFGPKVHEDDPSDDHQDSASSASSTKMLARASVLSFPQNRKSDCNVSTTLQKQNWNELLEAIVRILWTCIAIAMILWAHTGSHDELAVIAKSDCNNYARLQKVTRMTSTNCKMQLCWNPAIHACDHHGLPQFAKVIIMYFQKWPQQLQWGPKACKKWP